MVLLLMLKLQCNRGVDESQEVKLVWSELNTEPLLYLIIFSPALIRLAFISSFKAAVQCSRNELFHAHRNRMGQNLMRGKTPGLPRLHGIHARHAWDK